MWALLDGYVRRERKCLFIQIPGCSKSISLFSVERVIKKKTMDEVSTENNSFLLCYQEKQQEKEKEALVKLFGEQSLYVYVIIPVTPVQGVPVSKYFNVFPSSFLVFLMLLRTRRQTSKLIFSFFNNISFKSFFSCFPSAFHGDFSTCVYADSLTKQILFSIPRQAVASGGGYTQYWGQEIWPHCCSALLKTIDQRCAPPGMRYPRSNTAEYFV